MEISRQSCRGDCGVWIARRNTLKTFVVDFIREFGLWPREQACICPLQCFVITKGNEGTIRNREKGKGRRLGYGLCTLYRAVRVQFVLKAIFTVRSTPPPPPIVTELKSASTCTMHTCVLLFCLYSMI
jgi:hypothetical protein